MALYVYLFSSWECTHSSRVAAMVLGLVSGVMILDKTVYLPIPIICSALLIWSKRLELKHVSQLRPIAVYLVVTAAVVAPWTVRNYVVSGGKLIPVQSLFSKSMCRRVLL